MRERKWPTKLLCCLLVGAILSGVITDRPARAELVATESVITPAATPERDRARLRVVLDREDVRAQLQAYGVSAEEAAARVDALTDREVALVVNRLDEIPAGGSVIALLLFPWILIIAAMITGLGMAIGKGMQAAVKEARQDAVPVSLPPADAADLKWPPVNSRAVMSEKKSGSYGSGSGLYTVWFLGERVWQGTSAFAFSDGSTTTYFDARRRLLARVKNGTLVDSHDPYFTFADWPLFVGKTWPNRYRYYDNVSRRSFDDVHYDGTVEAYEDVPTPAGTFKAFKIALSGTSSNTVLWYSSDLGLVIKTRAERFANHYLGSGLRETELVSYDLNQGAAERS